MRFNTVYKTSLFLKQDDQHVAESNLRNFRRAALGKAIRIRLFAIQSPVTFFGANDSDGFVTDDTDGEAVSGD